MKLIKQFFFLYKIDSSFIIYKKFLFSKVISLFDKIKKIKFKKEHQKFLIKKKISQDWFSHHAYDFHCQLKKFKNKFHYLEIGSFEGNSLMFVLKKFKNCKAVCVDTWQNDKDYNIDFKLVEKYFNYNLFEFRKRFNKFKMNSKKFFSINKRKFDVIYIDGYHDYKTTLHDAINSWKALNINGILIFDDFFWDYYENKKNSSGFAINTFFKKFSNFKIIKINKQVVIKKINN
jgi:predicted O-methyltransferase YrrM